MKENKPEITQNKIKIRIAVPELEIDILLGFESIG
jgi:hypothetical protein